MLRVLTQRRLALALASLRGLATQCKANPGVFLHPTQSGQFALSFVNDEAKVKGVCNAPSQCCTRVDPVAWYCAFILHT